VARRVNLRRDRFFFFTGLVLLLVGGPGLVAGTYAHDSLRLPLMGNAYDAFGWVNQTALWIGIIVFVVGFVFLLLSLRGGVVSAAKAEELQAGRS